MARCVTVENLSRGAFDRSGLARLKNWRDAKSKRQQLLYLRHLRHTVVQFLSIVRRAPPYLANTSEITLGLAAG